MNEIITLEQSQELTVQNANVNDMMHRFIAFVDVDEITMKSYKTCLIHFIDWMHETGVVNPQRTDILNYKSYLATPHPRRMRDGSKGQTVQFSAGTQARYLRSVKMFFRWTADEKLYPNIADNIKGAKVGTGKKRDAFTESEAETILNSIDRTTPAGKRDYAMLFLTFTAGLRIIEMQRATIADLETRNSIHKLWILGKGRDEKESVEVPQEVFCAIMEYLDTRTHRTGDAALFAGTGNRNNEQALSEPSISRFLKQRIKDAGFDSHRLTPHSARHTCGTIAARHGMPPRQVQALLRHKNFSTTEQNYLHDMENQNFHSEQTVCDILMHKEQSAAEQAQNLLRSMTTAQIMALMPVLQAASMQNMTTV